MLAMDVNDDTGHLTPRGACASIASVLDPTVENLPVFGVIVFVISALDINGSASSCCAFSHLSA